MTPPNPAPLPPKRSWIPIAAALLATAACIAIYFRIRSFTADPGTRMPTRYVFAAGVTGDVRINYEIPGAPALGEQDGFRVVRIPPSRLAETSSPMLYGTADDEYLRERPDGTLKPMTRHSIATRKNGLSGDKNEFFHKTDELLRRDAILKAEGRLGADGKPVLGPPYELMVVREPVN